MLEIICSIFIALCGLSDDLSNDKPTDIIYQNTPQTINQYANENAWAYRDLNLKYLPDHLKTHISVIAAQWWQEANWRCDLSSKYADGCAQFTPQTAKWASSTFCRDLGRPDPHDPEWAYPCGVRYMVWLFDRVYGYTQELGINADMCLLWALTLKSYNGGLGNVKKEARAVIKAGYDPTKLESYLKVRIRAKWADIENDEYPIKIIERWQKEYLNADYGGKDVCAI